MARTSVYVPDALLEAARAELPADVSWSALLRERLEEALAHSRGCGHDRLVCARCRQPVNLQADEGTPTRAAPGGADAGRT